MKQTICKILGTYRHRRPSVQLLNVQGNRAIEEWGQTSKDQQMAEALADTDTYWWTFSGGGIYWWWLIVDN